VVVTSARTPVPGGVVVATTIVVVVSMLGPMVVLVATGGPTVVVVVATFGVTVDVVVDAGGEVVGETVVTVDCGSVDVDPPSPAVVVEVACPPLPGGAVVYGGKVPGSVKVTSRGWGLAMLVPSPSCPYTLSPQHFTSLLVVIAQVCHDPAATAAIPEDKPITCVGWVRKVVVPSPSCWELLRPQQYTAPESRTAQVCLAPALIPTAADGNPTTAVGTSRCVVVPSPI